MAPLYCGIEGCRRKAPILGMTGLQELLALQRHLAQAHDWFVSAETALGLREKFENGETVHEHHEDSECGEEQVDK